MIQLLTSPLGPEWFKEAPALQTPPATDEQVVGDVGSLSISPPGAIHTLAWPSNPKNVEGGLNLPREMWALAEENQVVRAMQRIEYWTQVGTVSLSQYSAGMSWYRSARAWAAQLAETHRESLRLWGHTDLLRAVAELAAIFSPQTKWTINVQQVEEMLRVFEAHVADPFADALTPVAGQVPDYHGATSVRRDKAWNNLRTRQFPPTAPKTLNFAENIYDPENTAYVTIDAWAYRAALGVRHHLNELQLVPDAARRPGSRPTSYRYRIISEAYSRSASRLGLIPCQLQAIVWVAIRERLAPESGTSQFMLSLVRSFEDMAQSQGLPSATASLWSLERNGIISREQLEEVGRLTRGVTAQSGTGLVVPPNSYTQAQTSSASNTGLSFYTLIPVAAGLGILGLAGATLIGGVWYFTRKTPKRRRRRK